MVAFSFEYCSPPHFVEDHLQVLEFASLWYNIAERVANKRVSVGHSGHEVVAIEQ